MPFTNLNKRLSSYDRRPGSKKRLSFKWWKKALIFLVVLTVITYFPLRSAYSAGKSLSASSKLISAGLKNNDFNAIKSGVDLAKKDSESLNGSLNWLIWLKIIPFFGGYYSDAKHFSQALVYEMSAAQKSIAILEPHKNELGLSGQPVAGQDKIAQLAKILDKIVPNLDKIEPDLKKAGDEVESIDVNKYPEKFGNTTVKAKVLAAKNIIMGADLAVTEHRDALEIAPSFLGQPSAKNYLLLFQNDKELRATGGFLTAFAFLKLDRGHLSTSASDDIYRLDERLLNVCLTKICPLTPPAPIVKYLPEANGKPRTAWSMRDSNISPDLPTSMGEFERMYQLLGQGVDFDGIITIDTIVVEELIRLTGPIKVFDTTYSAETDKRCNCPNVVYELEHYAEIAAKGENDRKAVLGTLMQSLLATILAQGPEKLPEIVNAGVSLASEKHIMFYLHDAKSQQAAINLGWAGEIKKTDSNYLHINDVNFAGGKSNLYVNEKVVLEVNPNNRTHKLTIEYKNPQPFNTWLNGILRDYIRIYVPQGSKLISSKGSQDPVKENVDEKLDKTYFEGFIQVRPQNSVTVSFEYTVPESVGMKELLIQKQPGAKDHHYQIRANGTTRSEFDLKSDKKISL